MTHADRTYLLATRSAGKLRELRPLFAARGLYVIDLNEAGIPERAEEASIEAFETFADNARAKAEYFQRLAQLPTFADDSGLAVHALQGWPGVRSKRWSGRSDLDGEALDAANNAMLLASLPSSADPSARYVCAAAFAQSGQTLVCEGTTTGHILREPRGESGFGYDPYFFSDELGVTFGEASAAQKNAISHRGRAFAALLDALRF